MDFWIYPSGLKIGVFFQSCPVDFQTAEDFQTIVDFQTTEDFQTTVFYEKKFTHSKGGRFQMTIWSVISIEMVSLNLDLPPFRLL